jgi:hypothetical protein
VEGGLGTRGLADEELEDEELEELGLDHGMGVELGVEGGSVGGRLGPETRALSGTSSGGEVEGGLGTRGLADEELEDEELEDEELEDEELEPDQGMGVELGVEVGAVGPGTRALSGASPGGGIGRDLGGGGPPEELDELDELDPETVPRPGPGASVPVVGADSTGVEDEVDTGASTSSPPSIRRMGGVSGRGIASLADPPASLASGDVDRVSSSIAVSGAAGRAPLGSGTGESGAGASASGSRTRSRPAGPRRERGMRSISHHQPEMTLSRRVPGQRR